ncbi:hypothetical protein N7456_002837 [Penicillium angulare]|uniref:Protein kinase domain-containing protein n=1 Tax=Penicillium angulare TaxID=116970 RepID=A0A9W9FUY8_9EURO|nr:hypothetical protein N7456_002837 [Penicillium angulare]
MGSVPLRLYNTEFGTEGWDTPLMENPTLISQDAPEFDFVTLVTAVSQAYSKGRYLKFSMVDGNAGEREMTSLGKGSVFSAHQREIKLAFPSLANSTNYEERRTRVVIKRTKSIFKATGRSDRQHDLRSFIHEVHILSQESLHKHANVVSLLGITWHCEQFLSATAVQPQLVLEAADRTLDDLLSSAEDLPFRTRFSLARDVVNGLAAIHACGIVHGDLKTVNILTVGYTAMIADFSHSWVDTGERLRIHVGTRGFMAPEMVRRDIIYDAKALDVYSVGVVLWRTLLKNDDLPRIPEDLDNTRSSELGDDPCLTAALEGMVACVEGDANRPRDNLIREILRATISQDPQNRSLQEVMREMSIFESPDLAEENMFDLEGPLFRPDASSGSSTIFASNHVAFNSTAIFINYQEFIHAPGSVHDQLVACLERISQTPNDPRRARALYELGVCSASQFGNPRQMIPDRSLNFFFEAAKHGDLTAKGYFKRHLELLLPNDGLTSAEVSEMSENTSEWLLEAAVAGHQVAFEDYISGDNRLKKKQNVLDLRAETIFDFQFSTVIDVFKDELKNLLGQKKSYIFPMNEQLDTVLHWAAYRDLDIHLQHLLDDVRLDINSLNCHGDTALMTACMVGNLKAALILLEHGCSVNITNQAGENCLHHIWRFTDDEARYLLSILVDRGIDFEAMAHLPRVYVQGKFIMRTAAETDPFPILHGRPIERMVGRGRTALVNEFLIQGPAIVPRNGNLIRRLILWASTLNFDDTRRLLIQYANDELPTCSWRRGPIHPYLPSIESSIWEHEGINKNYMDSVALGWLSSRGLGWSTPEAFWRMCSHGRLWIKRLHDTIQDISAGLEKPLCHFETSLLHALRSRRPLFCRVYLKIYIDEHGEFNNYQDTRRHHDCKGHKDPQISLSGFDIERGDSDQQALRTRVIDKILFNNDHTLLQLSIITGDRLMFLLLQEFQASLIRPWTGSYSEPPGEYTMERGVKTVERRWRKAYLNCYSILALHSKDIWFA